MGLCVCPSHTDGRLWLNEGSELDSEANWSSESTADIPGFGQVCLKLCKQVLKLSLFSLRLTDEIVSPKFKATDKANL